MTDKTLGKASLHEVRGSITDLLEKLGGKDGQEWLKATKQFLRKEDPREVVDRTYTLKVDYGQDLKKALEAGRYGWVHDDLTNKNFPPIRSGIETVEMCIVHPGYTMDTDKVQRELNEQGLRSATIRELLALGETYPTAQWESSITALGSAYQGSREVYQVPTLGGDSYQRIVMVSVLDSSWGPPDRLLAVLQ